jgi:hypothetical protein
MAINESEINLKWGLEAYLNSGLTNQDPSNFQPTGSVNLSLGSLSCRTMTGWLF